MTREWVPYAVLRAASLLAPHALRAEWLRGWHSELWYVSRSHATQFCLGAFRDALWVRRNDLNPVSGARIGFESPFACLGLLASVAVAATFLTMRLPIPPPTPSSSGWGLREVSFGWTLMLLYSAVLTPVTLLAMGRTPDRPAAPGCSRLRRWGFLALKMALLQPVVLCGFLVSLAAHVAVAPMLLVACWILALRWAFLDQRRRCPACLRLLTNAVRIGTPSRTFLEWYGAESVCSHGHGLLHSPATSASYSGAERWLTLDASWKTLFSQPAGGGPR